MPPDPNGPTGQPPVSLHARVGPAPFATLAASLYARIDSDTRIRSMFPPDLGPASESVRDMREFLAQFFGGPSDYSMRKGHPRLRARHMRFPIDQTARDAWLENALGAVRDTAAAHGLDQQACRELEAYFVHASQFMINRE